MIVNFFWIFFFSAMIHRCFQTLNSNTILSRPSQWPLPCSTDIFRYIAVICLRRNTYFPTVAFTRVRPCSGPHAKLIINQMTRPVRIRGVYSAKFPFTFHKQLRSPPPPPIVVSNDLSGTRWRAIDASRTNRLSSEKFLTRSRELLCVRKRQISDESANRLVSRSNTFCGWNSSVTKTLVPGTVLCFRPKE